MKKLLAVFLAVLMLAGMGASAFADAASGDGGPVELKGNDVLNQSIPVQASYQALEAGETYYVKLEWKGLSFIYHPKTNGTWNPFSHTYDGGSAAKWTSSYDGNNDQPCGQIKITNNSQGERPGTVDVSLDFTSTVGNTYGSVIRMLFSTSSENISNEGDYSILQTLDGVRTGAVDGPSVIIYVLPYNSNALTKFSESNQFITLGNINVTVSPSSGGSGDPPGPEQPGIEAVTPGPAEEIAANG